MEGPAEVVRQTRRGWKWKKRLDAVTAAPERWWWWWSYHCSLDMKLRSAADGEGEGGRRLPIVQLVHMSCRSRNKVDSGAAGLVC